MAKQKVNKSQQHGLLILVTAFILLVIGLVVVFIDKNARPEHLLVVPPAEGAIQIQGEAMCLPHKDTSGPQTEECAYGIQDDQDRYYSLSDSDPDYKNIDNLPINQQVVVTGIFQRGESTLYPTVGTIEVTNVSPPR